MSLREQPASRTRPRPGDCDAWVAVSGWSLATVTVLTLLGARVAAARRRELVIRCCHELRGPITAVRLAVEAGGRGGFTNSRLQALERELAMASLALDDLVDTGAARPLRRVVLTPPELISVRDLLQESAEAWSATAAARGAALRIGNCPDAIVRCHRLRLAQATDNLIANAIEHGGGEIELRARCDGRRVCFEVIDGGAGLPAPVGQLTRRRGLRGRGLRGRGLRGRGLRGRGLAIAMSIAREQGGLISAAPSERGARLVLELPVFSAPAPTTSGSPQAPESDN